MKGAIYSSFLSLPLALGSTIQRRQAEQQTIPDTAKAPNTFNKPDTKLELGQPDQNNTKLPDQYRAKDIDIPFGRILMGNVKYFQPGEMNTPNGISDEDGPVGQADDATQSACGIPDNVYRDSKVAIHPYWLNFTGMENGLDRTPQHPIP